MSDDEFIAEYVRAAEEQGRSLESADHKSANKAQGRILAALKRIRQLPDNGEEMLRSATRNKSASVRMWSAAHLLPLDQNFALTVLDAVAEGPGPVALTAEITAREWREGRLKPESLL